MSIKHAPTFDVVEFLDDATLHQMMIDMEENELLNTKPSYVNDGPDGARLVTFYEKHSIYIKSHPKINPQNYLANVRTMIRIRH
jgi:hypothetical protein